MTETSPAHSWLQESLLALYRRSRQSRFFRSRFGRRLFEEFYLVYKVVLEAGPISQLKPYVPEGTWAIDVGANIGLFSLRFARWVGDRGHVIAIEPEAENFASLRRRLAKAGIERRVSASQAVAAEAAGELRLVVNLDHPGDHRIGAVGIAVPAVTLDGILAKHEAAPVSLIKIDVQGAEMRVLRGATGVLTRCRPALFIEVDDAALRSQQSSAGELVQFLESYGYRPHRLRRSGPPDPISPDGLGRDRYEDVLFLSDRPQPSVTAP